MRIHESETVEEIRKRTSELLGVDVAELAFIDETYLEGDFNVIGEESSETVVSRVFGHNTSYVRANDGKFWYRFNASGTGTDYPTTEGRACGGSVWFVPQDYWNHTNLPTTCPGGSGPRYQKARFDRK